MLGLAGSPVYAQPPSSQPRRIEISAGFVRMGHASSGTRDANETTGAGGSFRLFSTSSELTAASGFGARVAVSLVRRIDVEVSGSYSRPDLTTHIGSDVESSNAPIDATVRVQQFSVGGAALWYLHAPRLGTRTTLFLRGGAGLERHLEDGGKRIVDGPSVEAGGGVKYLLASRPRGWWRGIGVRGDVFALVRSAAVMLDDRVHVSPTVGASLYLRF